MERTSEFLADIQRATPNLTSQVHEIKKKTIKKEKARRRPYAHTSSSDALTFNLMVPRRKAIQDAAKLK